MKISPSDVKRGVILKIDNKLYKVKDISHTHMARWWATYNFKVKDIVAWKTNTFTYNSTVTLEQAEVQTNNALFLYDSGEYYSFMENDTGEMYEVDADDIDDVIPYLKENLDVFLMKYEGDVIGVILPTTVEYEIASTVPGIKWDRSSAGKKPATLSNWLEVQVPLHKEVWQIVVVNTETGSAS